MGGSHTYASAIVDSQKTHARKAADFYPTPPDVTVALLDYLALEQPCFMWEPACGDGALAKVLEAKGHQVIGTDLREDTGYGQGGIDFLTYDTEPDLGIPINAVCDWIITNPPFKLAEAFIRKSLETTPNVAMLLKSQYWHAKSRLPLFRDHPPARVLPLTWRPAFLESERGRSPLMDVSWFVWSEHSLPPSTTGFDPLARPTSDVLKERFPGCASAGDCSIEELLGDPAPEITIAELLG